jgi:hypothetical protein
MSERISRPGSSAGAGVTASDASVAARPEGGLLTDEELEHVVGGLARVWDDPTAFAADVMPRVAFGGVPAL